MIGGIFEGVLEGILQRKEGSLEGLGGLKETGGKGLAEMKDENTLLVAEEVVGRVVELLKEVGWRMEVMCKLWWKELESSLYH